MKTYVALLRGVNVGGRAKVSMSELRGLFDDLGHRNARTYIQSGNVVFNGSLRGSSRAAKDIEDRIEKDLGVRCRVLLRTTDELATVLAANPYLQAAAPLSTLYVAFLDKAVGQAMAARLVVPNGETAEFNIAGREIYLRYPDGYGRTKLTNNYIEKRLDVVATTRNWNTVNKLHELASEL